MENSKVDTADITADVVISPEALLNHWQGHRRLTRKTIEAFPEKELFEFSIGGMRPFSQLIMEIAGISATGLSGVVSGNWITLGELHGLREKMPATKKELLKMWDEITVQLDSQWPEVTVDRFQETVLAFGQWEGTVCSMILYWIDNEIHHRAQGFVYLRALGIEPPAFWDRS